MLLVITPCNDAAGDGCVVVLLASDCFMINSRHNLIGLKPTLCELDEEICGDHHRLKSVLLASLKQCSHPLINVRRKYHFQIDAGINYPIDCDKFPLLPLKNVSNKKTGMQENTVNCVWNLTSSLSCLITHQSLAFLNNFIDVC